MPIPWLPRIVLLCFAASAPALEAQGGGVIAGTVTDSSARPIADVEVVTRPGGHRTRSDSAGRFTLSGIDDGGYVVIARKVGYAPERWDVKLSESGRIVLKFVLGARVTLDTVTITAARDCPARSLDGFECRRRAGVGGVLLDFPEIDETGSLYTADVFRGMPGFRVTLRSTRSGPMPVVVTARSGGCINSVVDGREVSGANLIPQYARDVSAMEVYLKPDSVPLPYQRFTWPMGRALTGRCSVVVYWTIRARATR